METRSIYVFTSEKYGRINIYNHWNNYSQDNHREARDEARGVFDAALKFKKSKDAVPSASFLDCFLKANPTTEIIGCGQDVPDCGQDYVYLVAEKENGVFLEVYGTHNNFSFKGTLEEFLTSKEFTVNFIAEMLAQDIRTEWHKRCCTEWCEEWFEDREACLAMAEYQADYLIRISKIQEEPIEVPVVSFQSAFIYQSIEDFNAKTGKNVKNVKDVRKLTEVIELSNGRFIAD